MSVVALLESSGMLAMSLAFSASRQTVCNIVSRFCMSCFEYRVGL